MKRSYLLNSTQYCDSDNADWDDFVSIKPDPRVVAAAGRSLLHRPKRQRHEIISFDDDKQSAASTASNDSKGPILRRVNAQLQLFEPSS